MDIFRTYEPTHNNKDVTFALVEEFINVPWKGRNFLSTVRNKYGSTSQNWHKSLTAAKTEVKKSIGKKCKIVWSLK